MVIGSFSKPKEVKGRALGMLINKVEADNMSGECSDPRAIAEITKAITFKQYIGGHNPVTYYVVELNFRNIGGGDRCRYEFKGSLSDLQYHNAKQCCNRNTPKEIGSCGLGRP